MDTDALVLKHQAISIHSADNIFIVLDQFHTKMIHLLWKTLEMKLYIEKIKLMTQSFEGLKM